MSIYPPLSTLTTVGLRSLEKSEAPFSNHCRCMPLIYQRLGVFLLASVGPSRAFFSRYQAVSHRSAFLSSRTFAKSVSATAAAVFAVPARAINTQPDDVPSRESCTTMSEGEFSSRSVDQVTKCPALCSARKGCRVCVCTAIKYGLYYYYCTCTIILLCLVPYSSLYRERSLLEHCSHDGALLSFL